MKAGKKGDWQKKERKKENEDRGLWMEEVEVLCVLLSPRTGVSGSWQAQCSLAIIRGAFPLSAFSLSVFELRESTGARQMVLIDQRSDADGLGNDTRRDWSIVGPG